MYMNEEKDISVSPQAPNLSELPEVGRQQEGVGVLFSFSKFIRVRGRPLSALATSLRHCKRQKQRIHSLLRHLKERLKR